MSDQHTPDIDGIVIYGDGSFRRAVAGWGCHGYTYSNTPMKRGIGVKDTLPTSKGYAKVDQTQSVTPLRYIEALGRVYETPTNNTAELTAAINAFKLAAQYGATTLHFLSDSQYVRTGLLSYLKKWKANGWKTQKGEPVANQGYWRALDEAHQGWLALGNKVEFQWVKGHDGNLGNELADANARAGGGQDSEYQAFDHGPDQYHNPSTSVDPLILKTRMAFNVGVPQVRDEHGTYYYCYQLGRSSTYGHKQGDTALDRIRKTDLIWGRRISDATFAVVKLKEADPYLDGLIEHHVRALEGDTVEIAIARLDNAFKPKVYQRIKQMGQHCLTVREDVQALMTANDELITKTQNPPRLAYDAVERFRYIHNHLDRYLAGNPGKDTQSFVVTEHFFVQEMVKKKTRTVLRKEITTATPSIDLPIQVNDREITIKLVLNIDCPGRNTLANLAEFNPKVTVLVTMEGPLCYAYATVIETDTGVAIYQSPYTQFVLPRE